MGWSRMGREQEKQTLEPGITYGYMVSFLYKNGNRGYIGIDSYSGGYPYFTAHVEAAERMLIEKCIAMAKAITSKDRPAHMQQDDVDYSTVCVMRIVAYPLSDERLAQLCKDTVLKKLHDNFTSSEIQELKGLL